MVMTFTYSPFIPRSDTVTTLARFNGCKELLRVDKATVLKARNGKKSCLHHLLATPSFFLL